WLQREAPGVEGDPLADGADESIGPVGLVAQDEQPGWVLAALADAEDAVHPPDGQVRFVEDLDLQAGSDGTLPGELGELCRRPGAGWLVDDVPCPVRGVGDDAPPGEVGVRGVAEEDEALVGAGLGGGLVTVEAVGAEQEALDGGLGGP